MKTTIKQLRRIIREAIEAEPQGSPYIEKIKALGEQDPMQAFLVAQSFPDFKSMDLSFLYPGILEAIAGNIIDQIPESSYPEMESSSRGWDIGFEFAPRPKRFYAADGMNLSDIQVEERKKLEAELAKTSVEAIQKYSDIIIDEFDLIGVALESKSGTGKSLNLSFTFVPGETINIELESFKNVMEIAFEYWGQPRNLQRLK
jgi:hypothetical protein